MAERGYPWQEMAKRDSVFDIDIKRIIESIPDERTRNIKGKRFSDATMGLVPFADPYRRIIYIPSWAKNYFELYELQWIVFHEVGHIINNHKNENPQGEDYIADEYAVRLQCRIGFGVCALTKISEREMRLNGERTINVGDAEIQRRINRLRRLGLPW